MPAGSIKRYLIGGSIGKSPDIPKGKRGGPKKGAGHPSGPSPVAKAFKGEAELGGELPHEFLLRVMRTKVGGKVDGTIITWDDRVYAAVNCINYFAPKLATVNVQTKNSPVQMMRVDPTRLAGLTVEELVLLEKVFGRWETSGSDSTDLVIDGTAYAETLQ